MSGNEQKRKAPMTEEQKQAYLKTKTEDDVKMKTDPKYKAHWEKRMEAAKKLLWNHDSE